ncbi:MAG: VWA domain-containing protein [Chloracidobacterium sp.]|nr:VWA domain-containing protein [Chloracidobacterium sp.]
MVFRKAPLLFFIFIITTLSAVAQDDDPIRVDSSIVRLNVGVVDQKGRPITNLDINNFELLEDGVKQEITRFEPSAAPFSVVIILDMSGSTISFRQTIRMSASRFIDALSPNDRVAVVEFYTSTTKGSDRKPKINLLNDFTTSRSSILNSINVANGDGKSPVYEAINFALDKLSKEKTRRKAVIVLTDGVDTAAKDSDLKLLGLVKDDQIATAINIETNEVLNQLLSRSDAQGVTIYPMALPTGDPAKLPDPTPRLFAIYKAARDRMQLIANRTGGTLNVINRLEEMGRLYAQVAADLRTLYTIEYQPTNTKRDGKWRAITLTIKDSSLISRTRPGYFPK